MTMVILMMIVVVVIIIAIMMKMIKIILIIAVVIIINSPFQPGNFSTGSTTEMEFESPLKKKRRQKRLLSIQNDV